jgi:hypothetical protein
MTDADFTAFWKYLVSKKYGNPPSPLTENERLFYGANWLRGSVPRSGFIGYFENSTGDDIKAAHEALRSMQLKDGLFLLQRAQYLVLGDRPLKIGSEQIDVFPEELTGKEREKASDELDRALRPIEEAFYKLDDDIYEALCTFADQHGLFRPNG